MASLLVGLECTITGKFLVTGNTSDISWRYMFILFVCLQFPNIGQYIFTHITPIIYLYCGEFTSGALRYYCWKIPVHRDYIRDIYILAKNWHT